MEANELKRIKVKDIDLSHDPEVEDAIEAIKESKAYIVAHVHKENGVGLIKNVHDEEPLDFIMSLLGSTATLGFIAKYLRSMNTKEANKFASRCTNISDDLFNLFLSLYDLPTLNHEEDDDESDE